MYFIILTRWWDWQPQRYHVDRNSVWRRSSRWNLCIVDSSSSRNSENVINANFSGSRSRESARRSLRQQLLQQRGFSSRARPRHRRPRRITARRPRPLRRARLRSTLHHTITQRQPQSNSTHISLNREKW